MLIDLFWFRFYELTSKVLSPFIPFVFPGPTISLLPRNRRGTSEYVVMITGASAGIGHDLTLHLAKSGYFVFAGVHKIEDGEKLVEEYRKSLEPSKRWLASKIHPITLDVTNQGHIDAAYSVVQNFLQTSRSVFVGLINNAAVFHIAPIELTSQEAIREAFNTNVLGVINITRRMLPLLRCFPGSRVICIGNKMAWLPMTGMGIYCAMEACIRGFTSTLDEELRGLGHRALLIEPGIMKSRVAWSFGEGQETLREFPRVPESDFLKEPSLPGHHEKDVLQYYERMHSRWRVIGPLMKSLSQSPEVLLYDVMHALQSRWPMRVYYPGLDVKILATVGKFAPELLFALPTASKLAEMTGNCE